MMLFKDDIAQIVARQRELADPEKDPVRLSFMGKKSPRTAWTHYGVIDTWEPKQRQEPARDASELPADDLDMDKGEESPF